MRVEITLEKGDKEFDEIFPVLKKLEETLGKIDSIIPILTFEEVTIELEEKAKALQDVYLATKLKEAIKEVSK